MCYDCTVLFTAGVLAYCCSSSSSLVVDVSRVKVVSRPLSLRTNSSQRPSEVAVAFQHVVRIDYTSE